MKNCVDKKPGKLGFKKLREIERNYRAFLGDPRTSLRTTNQQFGIFDEDEIFVGDICASNEFFTEDELLEKMEKAFAVDSL